MRAWLGTDVAPHADPRALVLRYLAAYGPASVRDMRTWCGVSGLSEVFSQLGGELRTFRDQDGATLHDVAGGPLPDPDTEVPVRFLPEYDNALRSHTDRRRVMADEHRALLFATKNDAPMPAFLVDGFVRGSWKLSRTRTTATLLINPYGTLTGADISALGAEAERLLAFVAADAERREVRFD